MHAQLAQGNACGKQQGALASVSIHGIWSPVASRLEAGYASARMFNTCLVCTVRQHRQGQLTLPQGYFR
eukprot:14778351-Alexandrium_andersonii.AAC.1